MQNLFFANKKNMWLRLVCVLVFASSLSYSASIKGYVGDSQQREPLVGALVSIQSIKDNTLTGLDGTFIFKNVPIGTYYIEITYLGYQTVQKKVEITKENDIAVVKILLEQENTKLSTVTILAHGGKNTEMSARLSEKTSMQVLNVMSANSIQQSPDLDVANVVQRMSGVTVEKNSSGEAQYAILRGMDKRYSYTLVNGMKISSPHNKHRFVPLNIFPSELADRVEVYKTLTPDMEGDASGGVINLVMKDSPNQLFVNANASVGYNTFFMNNSLTAYPRQNISLQSPRALHGKMYETTYSDFNSDLGKIHEKQVLPNMYSGFVVGNRFFEKKLGVIAAANYQNINKGLASTVFSESFSQQLNASIITSMRERTYSENQIQKAIHIKTDYALSPNHTFDWYNAYLGMDKYQVRQTTSTNFSYNYDPLNNKVDLNYETRLNTNYQYIYISSLHGKHAINKQLQVNWNGLYSYAQNSDPERTYFNLDRIQVDTLENVYPDADGSTIEWGNNTDRDISGFVNTIYTHMIELVKIEYKIGGMYRNKTRSNSLVEYRIRPVGIQVQGKDFTTIDEIVWNVSNPLRGSVGPLEYKSHEHVSAYYGMSTITFSKLTLQGGVRWEHTNQGYFQFFPALGQDSSGTQVYADVLPSLQCKYSPYEHTNVRVSYFKSINRPGFYEIVPYVQIEEDYTEFGNKNLKRARIHNFDVRYEYFPKKTEQLLIGVFYKQIKDPIEILYTTVNRRQYGYGPGNVGTAHNIGIETDIIKYFRWFGVKANYTYTHSSIITAKTIYVKNEKGQTTRSTIDQKRPLVGQSPHTANLSLLVKTENGLDIQLASSYNHDKLIVVSDFYNADYWMSKSIQLDASLEKKWEKGLSVFFKVNNILNTPMYYYIKHSAQENLDLPKQDMLSGKTLVRYDEYNRTFLFGIRKNFINH